MAIQSGTHWAPMKSCQLLVRAAWAKCIAPVIPSLAAT
jgi:hypothetical protein